MILSLLLQYIGNVMMESKTFIGGGSNISLLQYRIQMNMRWYLNVLILLFLISLCAIIYT